MYRYWTAAEDRLFRKYGNKEIAKRTRRSVTSVQSRKQKLRRLGVVLPYLLKVGRAEWTPAKDKIVAENRTSVAMRLLGHARDTIKRRRKALGLGPWVNPKKPKKPPPQTAVSGQVGLLSVSSVVGQLSSVKAIGGRTKKAVYLRRTNLRRAGKRLKWIGRER